MVTRLIPISILHIIFLERQIFQDSCQSIKVHLINACVETIQFPVQIRKKKFRRFGWTYICTCNFL